MNKFFRISSMLVLGGLLAGCDTFQTQRYSTNADTNVALKRLAGVELGVNQFQLTAPFSANCRAVGPLKTADGLRHETYIQKAFEDELKVAGLYSASSVRALRGTVEKLEFSSSAGLTNGYWDIQLLLHSNNGNSIRLSEVYRFETAFAGNEACRKTAEAFLPAVQNLVSRAVSHPEFLRLVK